MATILIVAMIGLGLWLVAGHLSRTRSVHASEDRMSREELAALRAADTIAPSGFACGVGSSGLVTYDSGASDSGGGDAGGGS